MPNKHKQTLITSQFVDLRSQSIRITQGLSAEDMQAQSMPDASPVKWHLAHTTWFFEAFILQKYYADYRPFNPNYEYLFNSYYESVGQRQARPERGLLTRPGIEEVLEYRAFVDDKMTHLLQQQHEKVNTLTTVGLHHEMQHQELLLTDVLHLLSRNRLLPALVKASQQLPTEQQTSAKTLEFVAFEGGTVEVGATKASFSYDCEQPRHTQFLTPFRLSDRLISNGEWLEFIADGGYRDSLLWLSDGWDMKQKCQWQAPLYWQQVDGEWCQFGLDGLKNLNLAAPVCHLSYYEANAFATWRGKRLPREFELEVCSETASDTQANFLENGVWRPQPSAQQPGLKQLYGDCWEWTQSSYLPHPGFKAEMGALGEYNGKFMSNQMVLKGGSCATPRQQIRSSYRNFFHPHQRWQFTGLRLAEDC